MVLSASAVPSREYSALLEMDTSAGIAGSLCVFGFLNTKKRTIKYVFSSSVFWVQCQASGSRARTRILGTQTVTAIALTRSAEFRRYEMYI